MTRLFALAALLLAPAFSIAAENYKIDPVHGTVIYRVSHLGIGNAYGRFNDPTGMIVYDKDNPSNSTFTFEVQTAKVDTANDKRDQHLQSPDFFDAKQFPTITFKSTKVEGSGDDFKITGDLTLHGVTKSITINMKKTGEAQTQMGYRTAWEATHDLKRSEYGMTGLQGPVGDDVHLVISFEAIKQ